MASIHLSHLSGQPPPKVLVVDDDRVTLRVMQEILTRLGCEVRLATNALEALDLLRQEPVELVFLDLVLPGMDGLKACETIKAHSPWNKVAVILLTGERQDLKSKAFAAGADDFLTKPIDAMELQMRLRVHLMYRRMDQAEQWRILPSPRWEKDRPGQIVALVHPGSLAMDLRDDMATLGIQYSEFHHLPEFIREVEQGGVDLLLLDASAVPGPLADFVGHLRKVPRAAQTPILAVCQEGRLSEEMPVLREPRVELVAAPLVLPELQMRVRSLFRLVEEDREALALDSPFLDLDTGAFTRPFLEAYLHLWTQASRRGHLPWCLAALQYPPGMEKLLSGRREALAPLQASLEPGDLLARMGDRTFVALLPGRTAYQGELFVWMAIRRGFKGPTALLEGRVDSPLALLAELASKLLKASQGTGTSGAKGGTGPSPS